MSFSVNISGIDKAVRNLGRYAQKKESELRDVTNTTVIAVDHNAKKGVPVDTGRLRSSIHAVPANTLDNDTQVQTGKLDGAVATNVVYAPFVEHGTSRMTARPYLFPAWESERPKYIARVKRVLSQL